ncbi:transporter substrate-binding domain-containing protein [Glutamicibacter nicotianae]|uniref:transporter substrate-binding domain-containing protein n=1 Tax=Glutamicibacter nicotianae TaxID=37929 RepID=UPI0031D85719
MTDKSLKNPSITRRLPLLGLCAVLFLSGCSAPAPESGDDQKPASDSTRLASVIEAGTLKVCTTGDYRPFTYLDPESGEWSGIDITMAKDLAESMGVEPEFIQTSWKDLMPDFLSKCDIAVGGVSISMERAQQAYYSEATLDEGKTPITLCENVEKYDTIKEINQPGSVPSPRSAAPTRNSQTRIIPTGKSSASRTTTRSSMRSLPDGRM